MASKPTIPTIIVDTREQTPWEFGERALTISHSLPAGDYSLEGLERIVAIERKSLADFVGTVIHGKDRFVKEITKLGFYRHVCIVVEASIEDVMQQRYRSKTHPNSVLAIAARLHTAHGIPVYWCGDRAHACLWAYVWLKGIWERRTRLVEEDGES